MRWSEARSANATNSVSSPAIEPDDLRPARAVERGRDRVGAIPARAHDEQQARLADLDRQVVQSMRQPLLAGRLGLVGAAAARRPARRRARP